MDKKKRTNELTYTKIRVNRNTYGQTNRQTHEQKQKMDKQRKTIGPMDLWTLTLK